MLASLQVLCSSDSACRARCASCWQPMLAQQLRLKVISMLPMCLADTMQLGAQTLATSTEPLTRMRGERRHSRRH